jgi:hypothetical protein
VDELCKDRHDTSSSHVADRDDDRLVLSCVKVKCKSLHWKSPACIKERLSTSAHTSQSPTEIMCMCIFRVVQKPYNYTYVRCAYSIFSREITLHTVIYGVHIRFWPTLCILHNSWQTLLVLEKPPEPFPKSKCSRQGSLDEVGSCQKRALL